MKVFRLSVLSLVLTVSGGILALAAQNRTVSGKSPRCPATADRGSSRSGRRNDPGYYDLRKRQLHARHSRRRSRPERHLSGLHPPESDGALVEERSHDLPPGGRHPARRGSRHRLRYAEARQPDGRRLDGEQQGTRKPRHPFGDQHVAGFRSGPEHHHVVG